MLQMIGVHLINMFNIYSQYGSMRQNMGTPKGFEADMSIPRATCWKITFSPLVFMQHGTADGQQLEYQTNYREESRIM